MRGIHKRLQELEEAAARRDVHACVVEIIEVPKGQEAPSLSPCPKCDREELIRRIEVIRPAA